MEFSDIPTPPPPPDTQSVHASPNYPPLTHGNDRFVCSTLAVNQDTTTRATANPPALTVVCPSGDDNMSPGNMIDDCVLADESMCNLSFRLSISLLVRYICETIVTGQEQYQLAGVSSLVRPSSRI